MSTLVGGVTGKVNTGIFWGDEQLLCADASFLHLILEPQGFELWGGPHAHRLFTGQRCKCISVSYDCPDDISSPYVIFFM